jgi:hypothetical protein
MMPVGLQDRWIDAVALGDRGDDFLQGNGPSRQIDVPVLHPATAAFLDADLGLFRKRRAADTA